MSSALREAVALYESANHYLNEGLIRTVSPEEPNPRTRREWMEWLLPALGHPEAAYSAVHVAGTSGKGSVATMIAEILRAAGVRTGLHVSPYLQVSTEKLWADGLYASARELADLVEWIRPIAEARRGPHVPLHGMASVAIALEFFRRKRVAVGVMEAGVGGRMDLTNVMRTRVAVISSIGLDHVKTLGPDLDRIAWHKAGVIKPGCRAVAIEGQGNTAAREQAEATGAPLRIVRKNDFRGEADPSGRPLLWFRGERFRLERVPLGMLGMFQAENAALAVAAIEELDRDGEVSQAAVCEGLLRARLPGRIELVEPTGQSRIPVLLDGAHNPDKLGALLGNVSRLSHERLHVVYGAIGSREPNRELRELASRAATFVATEPHVYQKSARPAREIAAVVEGRGGKVAVETDPLRALDIALDAAAPGDLVLVTGSLYLCGEIRERWYPADEILAHRTSWF